MHEEKYFRQIQILEKSLACNKERVLQSPGLRGNIQQPAIHTIAMCGPDQILREEKGVGNEKVSRQMKKFHLKKEGNTVWPKLIKGVFFNWAFPEFAKCWNRIHFARHLHVFRS